MAYEDYLVARIDREQEKSRGGTHKIARPRHGLACGPVIFTKPASSRLEPVEGVDGFEKFLLGERDLFLKNRRKQTSKSVRAPVVLAL